MANELGSRVGSVVDITAFLRMKELPIVLTNTAEKSKSKPKEKAKKVKKPAKKKGN